MTTDALAPLVVPVEALQQHVAVLGKTGSGKTYSAKGLVEHLLRLERRVCILDPTGAWWGLRSSADGKRDGFPITIFGGDHADVAITEHAGHAVGELVGSGNVPAVIDLSGTMLGERHRFVQRFAESVFRVNRQPLHLIIDEADEFAPQNGEKGTEFMLGAIDRIVRRGRIKGFRVVMITQRPAVLNKNVLTQANTLIAMRLPSSQDRKAVELWVKGQADEAQAGEMLKSLSSLKKGEGWVWAPELGILKREVFPRISTFDSSRTPEEGEHLEPPKRLADVDLSAIKEAMAEAVRQAEENDAELLKKRVRELQAKLDAALKTPVTQHPGNVEKQIEQARVDAVRHAADFVAEICGKMTDTLDGMNQELGSLRNRHDSLRARIAQLTDVTTVSGADRAKAMSAMPSVVMTAGSMGKVGMRATEIPSHAPILTSGTGKHPDEVLRGALTGPQRRLVDAIAAWIAMGVQPPNVAQAAWLAGYSPTSSTFDNLRGACRTYGLIDYPEPSKLTLTDKGSRAAHWEWTPPGLDKLHARIREPLTGPEKKLLDVLLKTGGEPLGISSAAELSGYSATSSTFDNLRGRLRTLGLAVYPKKTTIAAAAWLFPEGLR